MTIPSIIEGWLRFLSLLSDSHLVFPDIQYGEIIYFDEKLFQRPFIALNSRWRYKTWTRTLFHRGASISNSYIHEQCSVVARHFFVFFFCEVKWARIYYLFIFFIFFFFGGGGRGSSYSDKKKYIHNFFRELLLQAGGGGTRKDSISKDIHSKSDTLQYFEKFATRIASREILEI